MIRAFIGIDFEDEVNKKIYEIQQRLSIYTRSGKWKEIDNLHLTLKFLDEINMNQKIKIDEVIEKIISMESPLELTISGLGYFKGKGCIPVLWLGFNENNQKLYSIQEEICSKLTQIGFAPDKRKYVPHITIGQNIIFNCDFMKICDEIGEIKIETNANNIFLFESEQVDNKRVYSKKSEYCFSERVIF